MRPVVFVRILVLVLPVVAGGVFAAGKPLYSELGGLTQAWLEIGSTVARGEGALAVMENPAGLAFSRHFELAASAQWPTGWTGATGSEFVALAMAASIPMGGSTQGRHALGVQGIWLDAGGLSSYDARGNWLGDRKTTWGEGALSWGVRLVPGLGLGVGVRVAAPEWAEEAPSGALCAGLQARLFPGDRLALAFLVESPWWDDPTPSPELRLGASFRFLPELALGAESRWVPGDDPQARLGLTFLPLRALRLGAGLALRGATEDGLGAFFGLELRLARLAITLTHAGAVGQSDILALGIRHAW